MTRKNRTSPIRTGFYYQDLWTVKLLLPWIAGEVIYKWIQVESSADEENSYSALDDIRICDSEDNLILYQIKHTQNLNADPWTWEDFLKPRRSSKKELPSLIRHLFNSYRSAKSVFTIGYAAFITDGQADPELGKYCFENHIKIDQVQSSDPDLYNKIIKELGEANAIEVASFFANFCFWFNNEIPDDLYEQLRLDYATKVRLPEPGYIKLLQYIQKEARQQYTKRLSLEEIRGRCEFDVLNPVNEDFPIPADFELFDNSIHKKLITDLKNKEGGIRIILGKPGAGKSTYLSKLQDELALDSVSFIKHHYYIPGDSNENITRLQVNRAIDSLKWQLKEYYEELGKLAYDYSQAVNLHEYIRAISQSCYSRGKTFVLIIDGLDHAIRNNASDELRKLLLEIIQPQPGLWIILGTQEIGISQLPSSIQDQCPKNNWIEITGFTENAIERILLHEQAGFKLPMRQLLDNIVNRLFELTDGNPLHLRYCLAELKNKVGNREITDYDLDKLHPYGGSIENYYLALWQGISHSAKTIAVVLTGIEFQLVREQLVEILLRLQLPLNQITENIQTIEHLLICDRNGFRLFHESFRIFVMQQVEFKDQVTTARHEVLGWLRESNYDDLKWSEIPTLSLYQGDLSGIISIDKAWVIDALCKPQNLDRLLLLLKTGAEAMFNDENYAKCLELSMLYKYLSEADHAGDQLIAHIWIEAALGAEGIPCSLDLKKLSANQLEVLCSKQFQDGNFYKIFEDVFNELKRRHNRLRVYPKEYAMSQPPETLKATVSLAAIDPKIKTTVIKSYLLSFEESGWSNDLASVYAQKLYANKQYLKIEELVNQATGTSIKTAVFNTLALQEILYKNNKFVNYNVTQSGCEMFLLYQWINGHTITVPALTHKLPKSVPDYKPEIINSCIDILTSSFLHSLLRVLSSEEFDNNHNLCENFFEEWHTNVLYPIICSGGIIGRSLKTKTGIDLEAIALELNKCPHLNRNEHNEIYGMRQVLHEAIRFIVNLSIILHSALNGYLNKNDISKILMCNHISPWDIADMLINLDTRSLTLDGYTKLISVLKNELSQLIEPFYSRSEKCLIISKLARINNDIVIGTDYLRKSASNALGYGYHKDFYLDEVLDAIETGSLSEEDLLKYLREIAPLILHIGKYTDNDEVDIFPEYLAEILARAGYWNCLFNFYLDRVDAEDFYLAEALFHKMLKHFSYSNELEVSLASTGIDSKSLKILSSLSNPGAKEALQSTKKYLGDSTFREKKQETSSLPSSFRNKYRSRKIRKIQPSNLADAVSKLGTPWEKEQFLISWIKIWCSQNNTSVEDAYSSLIDVLHSLIPDSMSGELADKTYPIVAQIDKEFGFELLCLSQARNYGWHRHMEREETVKNRWEYLAENYHNRSKEFFNKSIKYNLDYSSGDNTYFFPLSMGIRFFKTFGVTEAIQPILDIAISIAKELMGDTFFEPCLWINDQKIDVLDVLFSRLLWPSQLVRERASSSIVNLLSNSSERNKIWKRLLLWISKLDLETQIASAIIPIVVASKISPEARQIIKIPELIQSIPFTSVVIDYLLSNLTNQIQFVGDQIPINSRVVANRPQDYVVGDLFLSNTKTTIPPIINDIAKELGTEFIKEWSYLFECIGQKNKKNNFIRDFAYRGTEERILGLMTHDSEVYLSAFLLALDRFGAVGKIDKELLAKFALKTLPADISFLLVQPSRRPVWWPKFKCRVGKSSELIDLSFEDQLKSLIVPGKKKTLLGIDGQVEVMNKGQMIAGHIILIAFGYKITGSKFPSPEEIAEYLLHNPTTRIRSFDNSSSLEFLSRSNDHFPINGEPIKLFDTTLFPLVSRLWTPTINSWQPFRFYVETGGPLPFGPNLHAVGVYDIRLENTTWEYWIDHTHIGSAGDWTDGVIELERRYEYQPSGHYFFGNTNVLTQLLKHHDLRLGYLAGLDLKERSKDVRIEKPQHIKMFEVLNMSPIILPENESNLLNR